MQVGYLAINTGVNRRLMLPTTTIKIDGIESTVLLDTGASASFLQINWSKRNAIDIYASNNVYQVRTAMG